MKKELFNKKMIGLVMKQMGLRVNLLLSVVLIILLVVMNIFNFSYKTKIAANEAQIHDAQNQLAELERIVNEEEGPGDPQIAGRVFAPYDQIIPYIELLENVFAIIDEESRISLKDKEDEILVNRYADYEVKLKPGNKAELLFKALDQLHKGKYITKVTQFNIDYTPLDNNKENVIDEVSITIRLYFE